MLKIKPHFRAENKPWCYPALVLDTGIVHNTDFYTIFYIKIVVWKYEVHFDVQIGREI